MTNLAVIPARGGSKRIPLKNIRNLRDKPMIAYTIEAALMSGVFEQVIVSTDSEKIAEIALSLGAEVPFLRGELISDDHTPVSLVTLDALERLDPDGSRYDYVAQLMANCPLRTAEDICNSYMQFIDSDADSQISMTRYGWLNPWWAMKISHSYQLFPVFKEQFKARSQDLPELFCPTGAVWWIKESVLRREQTFHISGCTGWEISFEHSIDIDEEFDWNMAEFLLAINQNVFREK